MTAPLAGMGVLITRPVHQAPRSTEALRAAGAHVQLLPLLDITPLSSPELDAALAHYKQADLAVFVSANAASFGLAALAARHISPPGPRLAAIGTATVSALASAGVPVDIIQDGAQDSESLLRHPAMQAVEGQTVILFRGESERGGRRMLADSLRQHGAKVLDAMCYRRVAATHTPEALSAIADSLGAKTLHAIQVMSVESLDALVALSLPTGQLKVVPLLVPHERIAQAARSAGFGDVIATDFGDDALIETLAKLSRRLSQ